MVSREMRDGILECPCGWSTTSSRKFLTHRAKEHPDEPTGEFMDAEVLADALREMARNDGWVPDVEKLLRDAARKLEQQAQTIALDTEAIESLREQLSEAYGHGNELRRELREMRESVTEPAPATDPEDKLWKPTPEEQAHTRGYRAGQEDLYEAVSNWIDGNSVTPEVELHLRELQHMLDIECHYTLRED